MLDNSLSGLLGSAFTLWYVKMADLFMFWPVSLLSVPLLCYSCSVHSVLAKCLNPPQPPSQHIQPWQSPWIWLSLSSVFSCLGLSRPGKQCFSWFSSSQPSYHLVPLSGISSSGLFHHVFKHLLTLFSLPRTHLQPSSSILFQSKSSGLLILPSLAFSFLSKLNLHCFNS